MLFQTLDSKNECAGFYLNGKLHFDSKPNNLSRTWNYSSYLDDSIEYASLYVDGKKLSEVCPPHLSEEYIRCSSKFKSYLRTLQIAKINLDHNCFFDLVPERFLLEYYGVRNKITEHVFENYSRPANYEFLLNVRKIAHEIQSRQMTVNYSEFATFPNNEKTKAFYKKLKKARTSISYNIFGTITGRFTTEKSSFPILTFPKAYRKVLRPNNDRFVELDFNAAELRTLLSLSGKEQPKEDIHKWIVENVFDNSITRDESKIKTFAWLYNPEAKNKKLEELFNKEELINEFWDANKITTPFGRVIECDRKLALNYLIQSTTSDLFMHQMIKISKSLEGRASYIAFCMHDSLIIDFCAEDLDLISNLCSTFSDTTLGDYKVNLSLGQDYGSMKKMDF